MLVLSRKEDEKICIGDDIVVTVVRIGRNKVKVGVIAPKNIPVHRQEVYEEITAARDVKIKRGELR